MSLRGWGGSLATAVGVSAGAGAAQLGVGYGLGIFSWLPTVHGVDDASWLASLAWTVWIPALSVVLGTLVADRTGTSTAEWSTLGRALRRVTLALAAALGGVVVVALTTIPARAAQRADTFAPDMIVGGYAITGVLLGLVLAIAAVTARAFAVNLLATGIWLWLLAVVATADTIAAGRDLSVAQLGVWHLTADGPWIRGLYLPGALIAIGIALLIGAAAAWPSTSRRLRPVSRVGVAFSGIAGPALVTLSYLLASPDLRGAASSGLSAHMIAPYTVLGGLLGSGLVAVLTRPRAAGARPANPLRRLPRPPSIRAAAKPGQAAKPATVTAPAATGAHAADPGLIHVPGTPAARGTASVQQPSGTPTATAGTETAEATATQEIAPSKPAKRPRAPRQPKPGTPPTT